MTIRLIQINDVHVQDQQFLSRVDDTVEAVFEKLDHVYGMAANRGADVVVAGDLFNQKSPWKVSHKLVLRLSNVIDIWFKVGVTTYILAGTHDLASGRLDSLEKQPLGVLLKASSAVYIDSGLNEFEQNHESWVCWGAPGVYDLDKDAGRHLYVMPRDLVSNLVPRVTVSHGMLLRPGEKFFGDVTSMDWVAERTVAQVHMNGHPHWDQGCIYVPGGDVESVLFSNPGAMFRGSSAVENLTRAPKCVYFELDRTGVLGYEIIEIPHRPAREVFSFEVMEKRVDKKLLVQFEESVFTGLETVTQASSVDDVVVMASNYDGMTPGILEVVRTYLEAAQEKL